MEETPCTRAKEAYAKRSDEYWQRARAGAPLAELQRIAHSVYAANDAQDRYCAWSDWEGEGRIRLDLTNRMMNDLSLADLGLGL